MRTMDTITKAYNLDNIWELFFSKREKLFVIFFVRFWMSSYAAIHRMGQFTAWFLRIEPPSYSEWWNSLINWNNNGYCFFSQTSFLNEWRKSQREWLASLVINRCLSQEDLPICQLENCAKEFLMFSIFTVWLVDSWKEHLWQWMSALFSNSFNVVSGFSRTFSERRSIVRTLRFTGVNRLTSKGTDKEEGTSGSCLIVDDSESSAFQGFCIGPSSCNFNLLNARTIDSDDGEGLDERNVERDFTSETFQQKNVSLVASLTFVLFKPDKNNEVSKWILTTI